MERGSGCELDELKFCLYETKLLVEVWRGL